MKAFDDIRNKIVCGLVAVVVGWRPVIGFNNIQGYLVKETLHSDARTRNTVMLS